MRTLIITVCIGASLLAVGVLTLVLVAYGRAGS